MAMTAYVGLQGSGKSYECVLNVIIPGLAEGRRVVTNIAGLKVDAICAFIVEHRGVPVGKQGEIVVFRHEQASEPDFFPEERGDGDTSSVKPSFVQGGDLVVIDECWRWYATGEKLLPEHMKFFRMHRHFLHPVSGVSCDIVFVSQAIDDIQRKVRATIEKTFFMQKHKELGMDDRYVVTVYARDKIRESSVLQRFQGKYEPAVFALYSSYSQGGAAAGREVGADDRGKLLGRFIFRFGIPISVICFVGGVWYLWGFFHPKKKPDAPGVEASAPVGPKGPQSVPTASASHSSGVSDVWRLVGVITGGGSPVVLLANDQGRFRRLSDARALRVGVGEVEAVLPSGEVVVYWSGPAAVAGRVDGPGQIPGVR